MIARAFLINSNFLIFDEATSSLDFKIEKNILNSIRSKIKKINMTIIIISHRISTIQNADHIIILNKSKLVDQGSPEKLAYNDNWYSNMLDKK